MSTQPDLLSALDARSISPLSSQLLKWVGNKQRFACEIISFFPPRFGRYIEPFLGTGAVLASLSHEPSFGSDVFKPLVEIWAELKSRPENLKEWYASRWGRVASGDKAAVYQAIRDDYNQRPNGADLVFLCRSCYGGVVRFRQADGHMSTPCGAHSPISPASFSKRVDLWHARVRNMSFASMDYREAMALAQPGDMIYCDPPYRHSQTILYGAQSFRIEDLLDAIARCKKRGVYVALSIDGRKRTDGVACDLPIPDGLFEQEVFVNCGRSMLKRFQMEGENLADNVIADRLLLTYPR